MSNNLFMNIVDMKKSAIDIIGRHEGFRTKMYKDTVGIWTIGYGFNMESSTFPKSDVDRWRKSGISKEEADKVLSHHIDKEIQRLYRYHPWIKELDIVRQLAILDMTFNMGMGWLSTWKNTVASLKAKNYKLASKHIQGSAYARQVGKRALENCVAFMYGKYPVALSTIKDLTTLLNK